MPKKFYQSLISVHYSLYLTTLPIIIFVIAFLQTRNHNPMYRYIMMVVAAILAIVLGIYYKKKFDMSKKMKTIDNLKEYDRGGMLERSFILEDRMLVGYKFIVEEHPTNTIKKASYQRTGRLGVLDIESEEGNYKVSVLGEEEAQRFCAFLKRKNPDIVLENIEPKGNGTLKELGA